ncbi:KQDN repeat-containing protein (plasmid) [Legionella adelaidensis]|uniref:KQDN repeat-containing protein n=1 Tax=Legionella adelaidensis TaxID=45056 RepID=A0A0W0R2G5_9GAMM|nr:protein BatD [Legionella adelaidensis]KTC65297.1 KQDN repeat-containing protein [Legionella adelaidensis]VEH86006.1 KQDN repeat-containing protein [Legionella adelaidensis]
MRKYLLVWLFVSYSIADAAIITEVNPPKGHMGETFSLTLSVENAQQHTAAPDLTPLQKDFNIVGTERNLSLSIINGQTSSVSRWTILLMPKITGIITIPPIQVGNEHSEATSIEISGEAKVEPTTNNATGDDVLLKTEADPSEVFVNQEITFTVKLYNKQNLIDVVYQPPTVENALLLPLGEGKRYQTIENGEPYIVEEERYAIFPQKNGSFEIIPPRFNALVYDYVPRKVSLQGKLLTVTVKPIPPSFSGKNWFPAKKVVLSEELSSPATNFLQGSTLIRNITIQAKGAPGELIPGLDLGMGNNFKIYSEKPEIQTTTQNAELLGTAKIKVTYLFNKPGDITVPEVRVPWFNTNTGKQEFALLPARTFHIDAKEGAQAPRNTGMNTETPVAKKQSLNPQVKPREEPLALPWLIAIVFAAAWIITVLLWLFWRKPKANVNKRHALKNLQEACLKNNAVQAQTSLLAWARVQWPQQKILNLNDISKQLSEPTFKKEIQFLSEAIYSQEKKRFWQGKALWQCVVNFRSRKKPKMKKKGLPPINPD